jgi:hypothetical protein
VPQFAEVRATYYEASGTTSELNRRLGFAAIALIWLFSGGGAGDARQVRIDDAFEVPALFVVISLGLDLLQYVWRSAAFGLWTWQRERNGTREEDDVLVPRPLNWPTLSMFWTKVALMALAYLLLTLELASRLT